VRRTDAQYAAFAARHADVYSFSQVALWTGQKEDEANSHVPGNQNAFYDTTHLTVGGALYLAPYLCSAFRQWGFWLEDGSPPPSPPPSSLPCTKSRQQCGGGGRYAGTAECCEASESCYRRTDRYAQCRTSCPTRHDWSCHHSG